MEREKLLENIRSLTVRSGKEANILHYILHDNGFSCKDADIDLCLKSIMSETCYEHFNREVVVPINMYMNNIDLVSYLYVSVGVLGLNPPMSMPSLPGAMGRKFYGNGRLVYEKFYKTSKKKSVLLNTFEEQLVFIRQEIAWYKAPIKKRKLSRNKKTRYGSKKKGGVWFKEGSGEKYEAMKEMASKHNGRPFVRVIYTPMKG